MRVYAVFTQQRSTSATLQACAMQPRAMCGSSASNTSLIVPSPASFKCFRKTLEEFARGLSFLRMHFQPRVDERPDQPRPNRSLMVSRRLASGDRRDKSACSPDASARASAGQTASANLALDHINDAPSLRVQHRVFERNGEELVWPAGGIVSVAAVTSTTS